MNACHARSEEERSERVFVSCSVYASRKMKGLGVEGRVS